MLSQEDNEYLCRTGPGTPMGNLLRRYWLPALLMNEAPEPDGPPVRVRVLGEDLIAFRDTSGQVGLLAANCPHRGASLFFGRNEEQGLRCVYHGWKFDVHGNCVDMPSEPAESNFKDKIHHTAYPTIESAGMVWAYLGPPDKQPPFRRFAADYLPRTEWHATKVPISCNYMQANEGDIDSAHISFLHRSFADWEHPNDGTDQPGYPSLKMSSYIRATSRHPRIEIEETDYGFRYAGIRRTPNGHQHIRLTLHVLPNITIVADPLPDQHPRVGIIIVPRDDESCWRFQTGRPPSPGAQPTGGPVGAELDAQGRRIRTPENDYLIDRDRQRTVSYTGIIGVGNQDRAVTESMGAIYDRSREHLGTTDLAIIRLRQLLIRAARDLEQGVEPPALDPDIPFHLIRSEEKIIPADADWRTLATAADPVYREVMGVPR